MIQNQPILSFIHAANINCLIQGRHYTVYGTQQWMQTKISELSLRIWSSGTDKKCQKSYCFIIKIYLGTWRSETHTLPINGVIEDFKEKVMFDLTERVEFLSAKCREAKNGSSYLSNKHWHLPTSFIVPLILVTISSRYLSLSLLHTFNVHWVGSITTPLVYASRIISTCPGSPEYSLTIVWVLLWKPTLKPDNFHLASCFTINNSYDTRHDSCII